MQPNTNIFIFHLFLLHFQVYANLDIATAKATKEEQSRAKHHLLDVATPSEPFTVVHFRNKALPIVSFSRIESANSQFWFYISHVTL